MKKPTQPAKPSALLLKKTVIREFGSDALAAVLGGASEGDCYTYSKAQTRR